MEDASWRPEEKYPLPPRLPESVAEIDTIAVIPGMLKGVVPVVLSDKVDRFRRGAARTYHRI